MSPHVLIVDDEEDIRTVLEITLSMEGFTTSSVDDGSKVFEAIEEKIPDVIILDRVMKIQDGITTCEKLHKNSKTQSIPIIMLTALGTGSNKVEGLDSGADDYLVKPFDSDELVARVNRLYRRSMLMKDISPLTGLPGNNRIMEAIERRIDSNVDFSVLYFDLDNFKPYNDKYGFLKGDEIIKFTKDVIFETSKEYDTDSFIGHIGGDDFVVITENRYCELIASNILDKFDKNIVSFYNKEDKEAGYIVQEDRKGDLQKFEIMSLSCGIATTDGKNFSTSWEIVDVATTMKKVSKLKPGSVFSHDQRKEV